MPNLQNYRFRETNQHQIHEHHPHAILYHYNWLTHSPQRPRYTTKRKAVPRESTAGVDLVGFSRWPSNPQLVVYQLIILENIQDTDADTLVRGLGPSAIL